MSSPSVSSNASSARRSRASRLPASAACSVSRVSLATCPTRLRSSGSSEPSPFWIVLNGERRPMMSTCAASSSSIDLASRNDARPRSRSWASDRSISSGSIRGLSLPAAVERTDAVGAQSPGAFGPAGNSRWKPSRPSSTLPQHRPPWASATPLATNSPILLPAPSPGRLGVKSASTSSSRSSATGRRRVHCERPPPQSGVDHDRTLAAPPYERLHEREQRRLEPRRVGEHRSDVTDPLHRRVVGVAPLRLGHPSHQLADVHLFTEDLEVTVDDPSSIDEQPQDRVHAIGVVHDPLQHHRPLVLGHRLPPALERVAEPLHRRQGRADVVGRRRR